MKLRLLLAGVPEEKIDHLPQVEEAASALKPGLADSTFILYDVYTIGLAERTRDRVKERLAQAPAKEGESHED